MQTDTSTNIASRHESLKNFIGQFDKVVVAFSGGVDSSLVAYVAAEVLGERCLAVTSGSKSLKRADLRLTRELAKSWGMQHEVIVTDELSNPDYRANPVDRCFHCKTSLYTSLRGICQERGIGTILNGTNRDDLGDYRPGLVAADNFEVRSPLVETGFGKAEVRMLANHLGLDNADKPQSACLSSRFPYGSHITEERLNQVERAESVLEELGFSQYRVRHHEDIARLELLPGEFDRALENRTSLEARIKECGYRHVVIDLAGFRSGSLNDDIR